jgi:hypothetical protein
MLMAIVTLWASELVVGRDHHDLPIYSDVKSVDRTRDAAAESVGH